MRKGEQTRAAVLEQATEIASRVGLGGLSIGGLAKETGLSKSGLFAHFGSKEALQVQALEAEAERFIDHVVRPALKASPGEPRIRALFDRWLRWVNTSGKKGCLFVQSSAEFDDQPGAVRDALRVQQERWFGFLAEAAKRAIEEAHFNDTLDADQFAFEFHGQLLGFHHAHRMMRDPQAEARLARAFERLLSTSRPPTGAATTPGVAE